MRPCEISLSEKLRKLDEKMLCLRSRAMIAGSSVMPSSAADTVAADMPCATASLRNPSSHVSKLPVLRQLRLEAAEVAAGDGAADWACACACETVAWPSRPSAKASEALLRGMGSL